MASMGRLVEWVQWFSLLHNFTYFLLFNEHNKYIYYQMHPKTTEIVTQGVINSLDKEVWNALAGKAISKMPKYKLMK